MSARSRTWAMQTTYWPTEPISRARYFGFSNAAWSKSKSNVGQAGLAAIMRALREEAKTSTDRLERLRRRHEETERAR
jgi:hypothetical protein